MPLVLEDAFVGFGETEVDLVMRLFKRFTKTTSQIVLLTNNRFIRDYSVEQDIPCLDLPDKYSGDAVPTRPRGNELLPNTRYSVESRLEDVNRSLDFAAMDQKWNGACVAGGCYWKDPCRSGIGSSSESNRIRIQRCRDRELSSEYFKGDSK